MGSDSLSFRQYIVYIYAAVGEIKGKDAIYTSFERGWGGFKGNGSGVRGMLKPLLKLLNLSDISV